MTRENDKIFVEFLEKEAKYFKVYDQYRPNYNYNLITGKFYTSEALDFNAVHPKIIDGLIKAKELGPREKYDWPQTTNQGYGWFLDRAFPKNPYFSYGRVFDEDITLEGAIREWEKRQPKFVGIPFKY